MNNKCIRRFLRYKIIDNHNKPLTKEIMDYLFCDLNKELGLR